MIDRSFLDRFSFKILLFNLQAGVRLLLLGFFTLFLLLYPSIVHADLPDSPPAVDIPAVMESITQKEANLQPQSVILPPADMKIMTSDDVFSVSVTVPLAAVSDDNSVEPEHLNIATNFYRQSSSVDKRVFIDAPDSKYMFNARMNRPLGAQPFTNEVIEKDHRSWLVYDNGIDVIAYNLSPDPAGGVAQKEWIYARTPNSPEGSRYDWTFETMGRRVQLKEMPDGRVGLHHDILINGMDNEDETERQRLLGVVRMALPEAYIVESPLTAIFEPVVFWTSDGVPREGKYVLTSRNTLTVAVNANPNEYPLLIDPTINYGAWLGGNQGNNATVRALAVNLEEIYAGGEVTSGIFTVPGTVVGTFSSLGEGWVVEIADGSPPVVAWLQWLGGSANDVVNVVAVENDEVYAGGYSVSMTSWETVGSTAGTFTSTEEAWVVEISDGSPPTVAWLQWLGGTSNDRVFALAVNGDEVYAGGYSVNSTNWETVGAKAGTYNSGSQESWVIEIADGSPPTIAWLQWLGGSSGDEVKDLAVNGDEIYAGGYTQGGTSWETAGSVAGTYTSSNEGWVAEITDGSPPTLAWLQWLGGSDADGVIAIAVNTDEVYAGGYSNSFTSWDTAGSTLGTYNASTTEGWVVEIADGSPPTLAWLQWLGGNSLDYVYGLAVNGDEVYAGGYSQGSSWETVGSTAGTVNGSIQEAWVVEIADGSPPAIAWLQWLGGNGFNYVYGLAVNEDEIYAGGYSVNSHSAWETFASVNGSAVPGTSQAFITELLDGSPPTANWLQWLGGDNLGNSDIKALAVNGDEIYAGGSTGATSWPGTAVIAGTYNAGSLEGWIAEIADGVAPSIVWLQWLGGSADDSLTALAVNGDEIYAGGNSFSFTSWETVGSTAGTFNPSAQEGWVVEIADGSPPTVAWVQWLGGSGSDQLRALTVNGDEIYAGGWSPAFTSWETVGFVGGTYSHGSEGWVVEITDGSPPSVTWMQWLGTGANDELNALAVNGDEVYAGGSSYYSTGWDTLGSMAGTHNVEPMESEGWVVEILDGSPHSLEWLQWLGGGSSDSVKALAVNGDEVYAGGDTSWIGNWDTAGVVAGTANNTDSFLVEISDGSPPSLTWIQWLGGSSSNWVSGLAVNDDDVYVTGYTLGTTLWETAGSVYGTYTSSTESFVAYVTDGNPPVLSRLQWLGGAGSDYTYALAVNGDEVYVGGNLDSINSWEVTMQPNYSKQVAFYVEIQNDSVVTSLYWVGDSSTSWTTAANWSESSGGADATTYPVSGYTAIFDGNSAGNCAIAASTSIDTLRIASGFTRTVTLTSSFTTTNDFTVDGAGVFNFAGATTVDIQGSLAFLGGTLTAPSAIMSVAKSFTIDGDAEFIHNNGTLVFDGSSAGQTIITSDNTLYNLMFTDAGSWTVSGGMTIANDITLTSGTLNAGSSLLQVQGDWLNNGGTFTPGTSTVMMNGTSAQTVTSNAQAFNNFAINDGLIGYWKFDETTGTTAIDSSGYGNDGTYTNGPAPATTYSGINFSNVSARSFDGSNDTVDLTNLPVNTSSGAKTTVAFWMKWGGSNNQMPFGWNLYDLWFGTGATFGFNTNENNIIGISSVLTYDGWVHIAAVFINGIANTTDNELYLNGKKQIISGTATIYRSVETTARISGWTYDNSQKFGGSLDDFRMYNRTLSAAEIARLAAGNQPNTGLKTVTLADGLDVNGALTLTAGTLDTNGADITVAGSWLNYGGILTEGTRTVTLDGTSGAHKIQGGNDPFYNLTINGSGASWALQDDITVNSAGTLTLTAGTITQDTTLSIAGGTVSLNGATYTGSALPLLLDADFNLSSGTFTAPSSALIVDGAFNKTGATFTHNSGTVTFTSDAASTITTSSTTTFNNLLVNFGSGLIGYWKFDETSGTTAIDSSSYGNNGTYTNGPTPATAFSGLSFSNVSARSFDGSDDAVDLTNLLVNTSSGAKTTVAFWMKWYGSAGMPFGWNSYDLWFNGSGMFGFNTFENNVIGIGSAPFSYQWVHITAVFVNGIANTTDNELYINGNKKSISGTASISRSVGTTARISGWTYNSGNTFGGSLDDFRMYNRALSAGEVQVLAAGYKLTHAPQTFTPSGALDINGTLTLAGGSFNLDTNDPAVNIAGNITIAAGAAITKSSTGAMVTFDGDLTYLDYSGGANFGRVTIGSSPDMTTLASDFTVDSLTIAASDTLVTNGYEVDVNGPVIINGLFNAASGTDGASIITIAGDWTINGGGAFTKTGSTVVFDGTSALGSDASFNNMAVSGALTTGARMISIEGTFTASGGTFTATNSTVTFTGSGDQTVTLGGNNFYNLVLANTGGTSGLGLLFTDAWSAANLKAVTANTILRFQNNTAYTITGDLTMNGGALGNELDLDTIGEDAGNFAFTLASSETIKYAYITHMNVTDTGAGDYDLTAYNSANGGSNNADGLGNDDLLFDAATALTTLYWVGDTSTAWDNAANWSVTSGGADAGTYPQTGFTAIFDGNSTGNCAISASTSIDTLRINAGFVRSLTLTSSFTIANDITMNGGTFTGSGAATLDINGAFALMDGTFVAPAAVLSVSKNFTIDSDATFTPSGGTIVFDGTTAQTITSNAKTLYNLQITNSAAAITFTDAFTANSLKAQTGGTSLKFQNATTYTLTGALTLDGIYGSEITINTDDGLGTNANFALPAAETLLSYINVNRLNVSANSAYCADCTDAGNNNSDGVGGDDIIFTPFSYGTSGRGDDALLSTDSTLDILSVYSAADQSFTVGDGTTLMNELTIIFEAAGFGSTGINAADDLRVEIPYTTMVWDQGDNVAAVSGTAVNNGRVSATPTVTFEGESTIVIPVLGSFQPEELITVSGLNFENFTGILYDHLRVNVDGAGSAAVAQDLAWKIVITPDSTSTFTGGSGRGDDLFATSSAIANAIFFGTGF